MEPIKFLCACPDVRVSFNTRNAIKSEDFTPDRQRELNAFIFTNRKPGKLFEVYVDASGYKTAHISQRYWQAKGADRPQQPKPREKAKNTLKPSEKAKSYQTKRPAGKKALQIIDYSLKAFAIVGDTRPLAARLKNLGAKFNPALSCGPGWIIAKSKYNRETLAGYLSI